MFTWVNAYSVEIKEIDDQHKKLLEILNEIVKGQMALQDSDARLNKIVVELKNFANWHFSTEIKYMKQYHFSDIVNHKKEHDTFLESINTIESNLKSKDENVPMEILLLLKKWVVKHLTVTDQKFYEFLKKNAPETLSLF